MRRAGADPPCLPAPPGCSAPVPTTPAPTTPAAGPTPDLGITDDGEPAVPGEGAPEEGEGAAPTPAPAPAPAFSRRRLLSA